jgi:anti-sigma B factor antagonist
VTSVQPHSLAEHVAVEQHRTSQAAVTLAVSGEIDLDNADHVKTAITGALNEPHVRDLVVDLARLTYIDSTGVSALIAGHRLAQQRQVTFRVANPRGTVERVLSVLGLTATLAPPEPA